MTAFEEFLKGVDRGRTGANLTLSTGCAKLDQLIGGFGSATYYLIGANLGIGKTALVDHAFVLMPYDQTLSPDTDISIEGFYYSFEIKRERKIAKWVCHLIYRKYGMVMDIKEVYSKRSILSEEKYQKIVEMREYIDRMSDCIHIFDVSVNPTGIYKDMKRYAERNGKIIETKVMKGGEEYITYSYIPNDPKKIVFYVEDHVGLARREEGLLTKKDKIDKGSEYAVVLRNFYGISKVAVSQFNREIADVDRRRFGELTPQLEDFKDSGNTAEDADIVGCLFNPLRYNLREYSGMRILEFGGRYRNFILLKHRDGNDMYKHPLNMLGEVGHFREFPDPFLDQHYRLGKEYKPWK